MRVEIGCNNTCKVMAALKASDERQLTRIDSGPVMLSDEEEKPEMDDNKRLFYGVQLSGTLEQ